MTKTIAEQLKEITFANNQVGSKVHEIVKLAGEASREGKNYIDLKIDKTEFDKNKMRQLIEAVEEQGFGYGGFSDKPESHYEWTIKWA